MWRLASSLFQSILKAIQQDPELRRHVASHPGFWSWLAKRFSRSEPYGLPLTVGMVLAFSFLLFFLSVAQDLIANEAVVLADLRLLSLFQMYRSPGLDKAMLFLTYLGNWQVVMPGACLLVLYLVLTRSRLRILTLLVSIGGGEILVQVVKAAFARPRPNLVNALVPAQGPSFPSGHAFVAICFYGLVGWFAIDWVRTWREKAPIAAITIATELAIGFTRIYLGVHWPSDVIASFGLGAAWLTATVTFFSVARASAADTTLPPTGTRSGTAAVCLVAAWAGIAGAFNYTHPFVDKNPPGDAPIDLPENNFPAAMFALAPRFSEDITGEPMEPINVILIGSEADLGKAFAQDGWEPTDKISFESTWRLIGAELRNQPPPRAPGLPTFWRGHPNQRGFQHVDIGGSPRERHHLHLWDTDFRVSGNSIWLGTVHFDKEAKTKSGRGLLIHEVDPAVDKERDALRAVLLQSKCAGKIEEAVVTEPMAGKNAIGNPFFTDGKAIVDFLNCRGG
jgi:undecaprenyl-diphosphatase